MPGFPRQELKALGDNIPIGWKGLDPFVKLRCYVTEFEVAASEPGSTSSGLVKNWMFTEKLKEGERYYFAEWADTEFKTWCWGLRVSVNESQLRIPETKLASKPRSCKMAIEIPAAKEWRFKFSRETYCKEPISKAVIFIGRATSYEVVSKEMLPNLKEKAWLADTNRDEGIEVVGKTKLSFLDATTKARIKTPVRGFQCKHLECFDFLTLLRTANAIQSGPFSWKCPICSKPLRKEDGPILFTDPNVLRAMNHHESKVQFVQVEDSKWGEEGYFGEATKREAEADAISLDDSSDDGSISEHEQLAKKRAAASKPAAKPTTKPAAKPAPKATPKPTTAPKPSQKTTGKLPPQRQKRDAPPTTKGQEPPTKKAKPNPPAKPPSSKASAPDKAKPKEVPKAGEKGEKKKPKEKAKPAPPPAKKADKTKADAAAAEKKKKQKAPEPESETESESESEPESSAEEEKKERVPKKYQVKDGELWYCDLTNVLKTELQVDGVVEGLFHFHPTTLHFKNLVDLLKAKVANDKVPSSIRSVVQSAKVWLQRAKLFPSPEILDHVVEGYDELCATLEKNELGFLHVDPMEIDDRTWKSYKLGGQMTEVELKAGEDWIEKLKQDLQEDELVPVTTSEKWLSKESKEKLPTLYQFAYVYEEDPQYAVCYVLYQNWALPQQPFTLTKMLTSGHQDRKLVPLRLLAEVGGQWKWVARQAGVAGFYVEAVEE